MRKTCHIIAFLIAALLPGMLAAQADDSAAARAAAASWLASIDGADYAASWQSAASVFKSSLTVEAWTQAASTTRTPLGAVQSRTEKSVTLATSLPGAPDGNYAVLQFDTTFANKAASVETMTLMLDAGAWKVVGYFIK